MRAKDFLENEELTELNIDNHRGWGQTPKNDNVGYEGVVVLMKPTTFLSLAAHLEIGPEEEEKIRIMTAHQKSGGAFGAPTLYISIPREWEDGNMIDAVARVTGHEGRHRMNTQMRVEGNTPVETHIFISGFKTRNWAKDYKSDYTPEIMAQINRRLKSEDGYVEFGPFFKVQK